MKKLSIFLVALLCGMQAVATNLVLVKSDGAQQSENIAAIGKWVFTDNGTTLQLIDKQGNSLATELLDNIRKITFAEPSIPSAIEEALQAGQIVVYPNPAHDLLIVQGAETQPLRVFDMQGRVVVTAEGNELNVSDLENGTYLLQIGTQVVRFIKQ